MAETIDSGAPERPAGALDPVPVTWGQHGLVAAIVLIATVPFLDKAYHIDDVLYLKGVDEILRGHDAYHGVVLWDAEDGQPAPLFRTDFNPPLWKYVLAATIRLAGGREEWKLHLAESAFVWLAGFGVYRLSRRFSSYPVWCTALIIAGPFFLPGQNVMLEGPMLCFAAWSLEFECRAWTSGRMRWAWLSGVLLAAAILTKYTAGMLIPVLVIGACWQRRPLSLVVLIVPTLALAAWTAHNVALYGEPHLGAHGFTLGIEEIPARLLTVLRCIGAVTVFAPALAMVLYRSGRAGRATLVACLGIGAASAWLDLSLVLHRSNSQGWTPNRLQQIHYVVFGFLGAVTIAALIGLAIHALARGERSPHRFDRRSFLESWLLLMLVFNTVCVPFNAIRHLLLFFVPLTWLVVDYMVGKVDSFAARRNLLVASLGLGFCLAAADYEFAGTYRRVAQTSIRKAVRSQAALGRHVWFTGNWGFVYYASQEKALPLLDDPTAFGMPPVAPGDLLYDSMLLNWGSSSRLHQLPAIDHLQPPSASPFRTVSPNVHYYAVSANALPWEIFVVRSDPREPDAWFELPPIDDIVVRRFGAIGPKS